MIYTKSYRGYLLLGALLLLTVVSALIVTSSLLFTSQTAASTDALFSLQAQYISHAGIERGILRFKQNPGTYWGEGPIIYGAGQLTIAVFTTDTNGQPLNNQYRISSTGLINNGTGSFSRSHEVIAGFAAGIFNDHFIDLNNFPNTGPNGDTFNGDCPPRTDNTTVQRLGGTLTIDNTQNAPASPGGALRARVTTANSRLTQYLEHVFTPGYNAGQILNISFYYKKDDGTKALKDLMQALDLVASDNTIYRVWSNCSKSDIPWSSVNTTFTVPINKTITKLRLGFDIYNGNKTQTLQAYFDALSITSSAQLTVIW